ncbi:FAD:protein FMN transferase [Naasia lichenicola]|uniref:FAD:protein FMN transferase n=1 Tax=Naasia lichenicola TaxID=2565933 RepID=A0A4S4FIV4_9MICO|nr:FAD:protein FMN transferase [Naasia lichenicola]THG30018.1 FAD:protein FMN transferase [Naasia lichenicola]
MRHVFPTMGTVASIELPDDHAHRLADLRAIFRATQARYSLFDVDSELSLIARGALDLTDSSDAMRETYLRALEWRTATAGLFSPHRPDGILDLNGIVKADAIEQAGAHLDAVGCDRWTINVGGDILVRGADDPWVIGIADPTDAQGLISSVSLRPPRRAVATSGSAQRGDHIWLGGDPGPARFVQVTVVADDIVTADVLATAIVAGGREALDDIADRWPIDVLAVDREGQILATPGLRPQPPAEVTRMAG